jgi:uncharacterized protein involved in exopolysaccharide biosynthesis
MSTGWYKFAFAAMALGLAAACASGPTKAERQANAAAAESQCQALASEYAHVVRNQGEAVARYGTSHPRRAQIIAQRDRLRAEMADTGAPDVRTIAATALGTELAHAKADRAKLLSRYSGSDPRVIEADEEIYALEDAIAAETGRHATRAS